MSKSFFCFALGNCFNRVFASLLKEMTGDSWDKLGEGAILTLLAELGGERACTSVGKEARLRTSSVKGFSSLSSRKELENHRPKYQSSSEREGGRKRGKGWSEITITDHRWRSEIDSLEITLAFGWELSAATLGNFYQQPECWTQGSWDDFPWESRFWNC